MLQRDRETPSYPSLTNHINNKPILILGWKFPWVYCSSKETINCIEITYLRVIPPSRMGYSKASRGLYSITSLASSHQAQLILETTKPYIAQEA